MNVAEVARLLAIISSVYQNFRPDSMEGAIEAWHMVLSDQDADGINKALKTYIQSAHEFAPNPGQLIQMAKPPEKSLSEMEAWSMVRKAITNGIYGAEQEYSKLPPTVQKAVGDPGQLRAWAMMEIDSLQTVAQSNFMRVYRAETKKADDNALRLEVQEQLRIGAEE